MNSLERYSRWLDQPWLQRGVLLLLALVPTFAVLGPFGSIKPGASGFPYFYRIAWLLLALVAIPMLATAKVRRQYLVWFFGACVAMWAVWGPITLRWSPNPTGGKKEFMSVALAAFGAWIVLIASKGDGRRIDLMRWSWVVSALLGVVIVIFETFTAIHLVHIFSHQRWEFVEVWASGFRHNPNDFAATFAAGYIASLSQLLRSHRWWQRGLLTTVLIFSGYLTLATSSRAATYFLIFISCLALAWCLRPRWQKFTLLAICAALLSLTIFNGLLPGVGSKISKPVSNWAIAEANHLAAESLKRENARKTTAPPAATTTTSQPSTSPQSKPAAPPPASETTTPKHEKDPASTEVNTNTASAGKVLPENLRKEAERESDQTRKDLTLWGIKHFKEKPILGWGAGATKFLRYTRIDAAEWWPDDLHNSFLQTALCYGIIGLIPIAGLYLALAVGLLRNVRRFFTNPNNFEALAMIGLSLCFTVMGSYTLGDVALWLVIAYAAALLWQNSCDHRRQSRSDPATGAPQIETSAVEPGQPI